MALRWTLADLTLTRFAHTPFGTFGELGVVGVMLYTVEKPWRGNERRVSCIPPGEYRCRPRVFFRKGYDAIEIMEVPGRTHILFHRGNRARDVEGCIAVGADLGSLGGDWAVLNSKAGFGLLMKHYGDQQFSLEIQDIGSAAPQD